MAHHYQAQLGDLYRALEHDEENKRFEDESILVPEAGELKIDVRGDLAGILSIAAERKNPPSGRVLQRLQPPVRCRNFRWLREGDPTEADIPCFRK